MTHFNYKWKQQTIVVFAISEIFSPVEITDILLSIKVVEIYLKYIEYILNTIKVSKLCM